MIKKQQGLSITSLLVGLALSVIMATGLITVYSNTQANFKINEELLSSQDNARFFIYHLREMLKFSGYDLNNPPIEGVTGPSQNDTITIYTRGTPSGITTDCSGTVVANGMVSKNRYVIAADASGHTIAECRYENPVGAPQQTITIAKGVEAMQIRYASVTSAGDKLRYINADDIEDFANVHAVRLAFVIRSVNPISHTPIARTFQLLDGSVFARTDEYFRQVYYLSEKFNSYEITNPASGSGSGGPVFCPGWVPGGVGLTENWNVEDWFPFASNPPHSVADAPGTWCGIPANTPHQCCPGGAGLWETNRRYYWGNASVSFNNILFYGWWAYDMPCEYDEWDEFLPCP